MFNHGQSSSCHQQSFTIPIFFVLLQLLFVFVSGTFLVNNVLAKPLYLENLDGTLGNFERGAELQHPPVNETSQSRGKRDVNVLYGIADLCDVRQSHELSNSGCVRAWLYCNYNQMKLKEPQCATHSVACLPSVARSGFPQCKPVYNWRKITLLNGQQKWLKLKTKCECA